MNKTLVAPFSARPLVGAPVSVPITWDELDDPDLRPDRWNLRNVGARLADAGDPLAPLVGLQQRLPALCSCSPASLALGAAWAGPGDLAPIARFADKRYLFLDTFSKQGSHGFKGSFCD